MTDYRTNRKIATLSTPFCSPIREYKLTRGGAIACMTVV
jgi:hypothetical protein